MGPNSSLQDICYAVSLRTLRADFGITCAVLIYSENIEYEVFPSDIEIPLVCFFFYVLLNQRKKGWIQRVARKK